MTLAFRLLLILGALVIFVAMMRKIRKSEVKISDSVFWLLFVASLVVLAIFPEISFFFSNLLGIESPANLMFLYVIAVLLVREFVSTAEISRLRSKLTTLTQELALDELKGKEEADREANAEG